VRKTEGIQNRTKNRPDDRQGGSGENYFWHERGGTRDGGGNIQIPDRGQSHCAKVGTDKRGTEKATPKEKKDGRATVARISGPGPENTKFGGAAFLNRGQGGV